MLIAREESIHLATTVVGNAGAIQRRDRTVQYIYFTYSKWWNVDPQCSIYRVGLL